MIWPASGLARKAQAAATSSGRLSLPVSDSARAAAWNSCGAARVMGVSTQPGSITFTVTPWGPSSRAALRASPINPALLAA
ncbi:MAG TPA: hypothetical protein VGC54_10880 [Planctomycetota bacterium]